MALNRVVAELPESLEELCLVRFGLVARRLSAVGFVWKMEREVARVSAEGLLRSERFSMGWRHVGVLQYWAGFEALDAWSHRSPHADWWRAAVDRMRTKGDFGVYHEAYVVPRANVETIYLDCPPIGLASFGTIGAPVGPKTTAKDRLGRRSS
jgi:hypothetical protein